MWTQLLILLILGLSVFIGGSLYYYYLVYNKNWNELNIWIRIGMIALVALELLIISTGIFYIIFSLLGKTRRAFNTGGRFLTVNPPNEGGPDTFFFFESLQLEEPLGSILQILFLKLFTPDVSDLTVVPTLNEREVQTLKDKINEFIKFYRNNEILVKREYSRDQDSIIKYLFQLSPSNRFIYNFLWNGIIYCIDVENPLSGRMSQDISIRELCQENARVMMSRLQNAGLDEIPTEELIYSSRICYEYISSINRLNVGERLQPAGPSARVSRSNSIASNDGFVDSGYIPIRYDWEYPINE